MTTTSSNTPTWAGVLKGWQLIGFSVSTGRTNGYPTSTLFVWETKVAYVSTSSAAIDLSSATVLRIGSASTTNSFVGDVSGVKIMTPGSQLIIEQYSKLSISSEMIKLYR